MELKRLQPRLGPFLCMLIAIAVLLSPVAPRLLDYTIGVGFITGSAYGMQAWFRRSPVERSGLGWGLFHPLVVIGLVGLFGGGSIAWGWLTAARVTAGVVAMVILPRLLPPAATAATSP